MGKWSGKTPTYKTAEQIIYQNVSDNNHLIQIKIIESELNYYYLLLILYSKEPPQKLNKMNSNVSDLCWHSCGGRGTWIHHLMTLSRNKDILGLQNMLCLIFNVNTLNTNTPRSVFVGS